MNTNSHELDRKALEKFSDRSKPREQRKDEECMATKRRFHSCNGPLPPLLTTNLVCLDRQQSDFVPELADQVKHHKAKPERSFPA